MKMTSGAVAIAALVGATLASAQAAPPHVTRAAAASTVPTATKAFPMFKGMTDLGAVSGTQAMHVVLGLQMRNKSYINQVLLQQNTLGDPLYEKYLTPQQTLTYFSPTGASVNAVATWLSSAGFSNIQVTPDNMLVTADATAAVVSSAFATQIDKIAIGKAQIFANVKPAYVPPALANIVLGVEGLNNLPAQTSLRHTAHPALAARPGTTQPCQEPVGTRCVLNSYGAQGFQLAYDAPQPLTSNSASNTPIAIFAEGKVTNVLTDLRKYEQVYGLPQVPVTVVYAGVASPDVSGQDEFDLDTQTSTGIAQNVKRLYIYVATSLTDADTSVEFDRFKTDKLAAAGSASFGSCEIFPATDGSLLDDDEIFAEAAVQGQTVFSSAGDNGTTCPVVASTGVPGTGLPFQSYPGTSPYVVSVGGTTLVTTVGTGAYSSEVTWVGTGGGSSTEESSPFWQQGVVPAFDYPPSAAPAASTFKSVPDIAMDADPNTGANIYVNGVATGVGGTSLASPLSLGVWARLLTHFGNCLGFASPLLYQEYKNHTTYNSTTGLYIPPTPPVGATNQLIGGYHDILVGSNGLVAQPGYDQTTGLGTFDIKLQLEDLPLTYPH